MSGPVHVVGRKPSDCNETEIGDFMSLVLAGGEVTATGLEGRIRAATSLVFLNVGCCFCGVAALKRPEESYRKRIASSSGVSLPLEQFPYELGWVFVMPSSRGRHFSLDLAREAIASAGCAGVFATSRTDNPNMHATLAKLQFVPIGKSYRSGRGGYQLQLFVRHAAQQPVAGDAHEAARA